MAHTQFRYVRQSSIINNVERLEHEFLFRSTIVVIGPLIPTLMPVLTPTSLETTLNVDLKERTNKVIAILIILF